MKSYDEFIQGKIQLAPLDGIEILDEEISQSLKPHQRDAVRWAVRGGRRALFESFGLGKTIQELEWCRILVKKTGGKALIVLPLGVRQEFTRDAEEILGIQPPEYVRNQAEADAAQSPILMTNYERIRDGNLDPKGFSACALDEAACLRSYGSKTTQVFLEKFRGVRFKLCCTATPSPNQYKELLHYGDFLEIMDSGQALTRFFQRNSQKAGDLKLYPSQEEEFWAWLSSWALFLTKPSDLSPEYSDKGYDLPPLKLHFHCLCSRQENSPPIDPDGQCRLFREASLSLPSAAREKRESIPVRVQKAAEIVAGNPEDHFILWHDLEEERREIKRRIPEAQEVCGSMELEERERRVTAFSQGKTRILATKKSISGSGCNFQRHCRRAVFLGVDYDFNDFIQAVHRIYRFLQTREVVIDVLYMDTESEILRVLKEKWERHQQMVACMTGLIREKGLSALALQQGLKRTIGVKKVKIERDLFTAVNNDCVLEAKEMKENSVDLIMTSIPFSNHYEYTPSYLDFGHNLNNDVFFQQLDYLTPELLRVLKPGRNAVVHVKDRILYGNVTGDGMPTLDPFSDRTVEHFMKHGFRYMGRITIVTDVVRENNQTYRLGWTEKCRDGTKMGVGCPEYLLLFRKLPTDTSRAWADQPVEKSKEEYSRGQWQLDAHGYWRSSGDRTVTAEELRSMDTGRIQKAYREYSRENIYQYEDHVQLAQELENEKKLPAAFMVIAPGSWSPWVWDDILRMRTLNMDQKRHDMKAHVCPLQLDLVERCIRLFSSPGEWVLDPFAGIFTVPMMAVRMGRKGYGIELNPEYFRDGVGYCEAEMEKLQAPTLFDFFPETLLPKASCT